MTQHIRPALVLLALFTLLTGFAYPLAITGLAHAFFPRQAGGSLIEQNGVVVGSSLIGQPFSQDKYFHPRPSATTDTDPADPSKTVAAPYNAQNSAGSNAGPTAKSLIDRVAADTTALKADNPNRAVPVDLVTTSASGLDPDITPDAAEFQAARVARTRGIPFDTVLEVAARNTHERLFGLFGERAVNVLELNRDLDAMTPPAKASRPAATQ